MKPFIHLLAVLSLTCLFSVAVHSQAEPPIDFAQGIVDRVNEVLCVLFAVLLYITASVVALSMIWAGAEYLMSEDSVRRMRARNRVIYSVIGLIFVLVACPAVNYLVTNTSILPFNRSCNCNGQYLGPVATTTPISSGGVSTTNHAITPSATTTTVAIPPSKPCTGVISSIASTPGIKSVTIYESTDWPHIWTYSVTDPRLAVDIPIESGTARDESTTALEYYDFFISDANGHVDPAGGYITIDCFVDNSKTNEFTGNNIDSVWLNFDDGTAIYADIVSHYRLGSGLSGNYLSTNGYADHALGSPDHRETHMGDQYSGITVGFCRT